MGSDNVDRLSQLPTDLICRILSFLPTKYAVRSAILSRRWKNISASLTVLDFDMDLRKNSRGNYERFDSYEKDHLTKFMDFVDQLLGIRLNVRIGKFRFICSDSFDMVKLFSWLKMPTMSNLHELDLEVVSDQKLGVLPSCIFRYNTLVVLKLRGKFALDLPSEVSLPSLKSLYLNRVAYVNDASLHSLLCGCHVLEDLNIQPNEDVSATNYVITVPSLKRLTLIYFNYDEESRDTDNPKDTLSLHTPNLEYLGFSGQMPQLISVTKMPFLSKAVIRMSRYCGNDEEYEIGPSGLFEATPNVSHLSLSGDTQLNLEAGLSRNESMFQQLIHLKLSLATWFGPMLLPYFLRVSPKLRRISVHDGISSPGSNRQHFGEDMFPEHDWIPPNNVPECLLSSLKKFEVLNLCGEAEKGMNMIKYFLKNAMVLEKMTIHIRHLRFRGSGVHCFSKREELMNYPRGSPYADLCIDTRLLVF